MLNKYKMLFLRQSYKDSFDNYKCSLKGGISTWDWIVLTASNDMQAAAYREQIDYRLKKGYLPKNTKYAVIPDRDGMRVGSGGATLSVLKHIAEADGTDFYDKKILCIHSGGDSKRIPQYSACGKIFSPVPRMLPDGRPSTLFDECIISMSGVPSRIENGLLVCSGDVLLLFNSLQIDFYGEGAAALSVKESSVVAQNHGVFLGNESGFVSEFLHKQSLERLKKSGAEDGSGNVNLDTGAVIFSAGLLNRMYSLIDTDEKYAQLVNEHVRLSLYADFLYPLAESSTLEKFYKEQPEGAFSPELDDARKRLWGVLHEYKLRLINCSPASFLHFGTTYEVLKLMTENISDYSHLDWKKIVNSNYTGDEFSVYNSYIHPKAKISQGCYIENCDINEGVTVGENSVVSGVALKNVSVPANSVLHGLKLSDGTFSARFFDVDDNPKKNKWFGKPIDQPLWTKNLFPVRETMDEAVSAVLNGDLTGKTMSLESSFNSADVTAILPWIDKLNDKISAEKILESIYNGDSVEELACIFTEKLSQRVDSYLMRVAEKLGKKGADEISEKLRIYYYLSILGKNNFSENRRWRCFKTVKELVEPHIKKVKKFSSTKESVTVRLPVRVNWAGGWSDTPPYCVENGGTVLNAAIMLNDQLPIEVTVSRADSNAIILESTDIGSYKEFCGIEELRFCTDTSDPFAIHKAALVACGIITDSCASFQELTERIGGGLYINTRVIGIPKGSGLGTSSILSAACVKGLSDFFSLNLSDDEIFSAVLLMEQLMSTGGGWQDQVGGMVPGIKIITTSPERKQSINYGKLNLDDRFKEELERRFVLIYTGQRRLARNLLRNVMGKYIGGDPEVKSALYRIQQLAVLMKFELERSNMDGFCNLLNEHWELSKRIDSECTNTCINQIFMSIDDLISGKMICGAGGGGFIQVILKKGITAEALSERLNDVFGDSGVCVWQSSFVFD